MQERRKLINLVLALGAVALGAIAQGRFVARELGDALILYLVAIIVFIYACRPWEKVEAAETSGDGHDVAVGTEPPAEPVVSPWRLRGGIALLFLAMLYSFLSLRSFGQRGGSPGAWGLYLVSLVLFVAAFYAWEGNQVQKSPLAPPGRKELILLAIICAMGAFLRFYQLQSIPFGLFFDEANNGLDAVRVIRQRVYPVYFEANYGRGALFIYLLALSFKLFGASVLAMRLATAVLGVLTILAFYFLFRQLFGPGLGLVGAYLIATSRWHINFSRVVFDAVLLPLLAALSFYFLFKGLRSRRRTDFLWGGLALGLGLHTYAPFRLVPFVIVLFLLYKVLTERGFVRRSGLGVAIFVLASFMVFAPLGQYALDNWKAFTSRAKEASILTKRDQPDLTKALWNNTRAHLLMFNYRGDRNGRHNLPGEPMLDFATAVLFALGLGYSLYRWREPRSFFFIACFVVLLLGGILSVDFEAPQALRAIGTLPAACFFACLTLERLWVGCRRSLGSRAGLPALAVSVPLLAYSGWANFHTYFYSQARDFAVWNAFSTPETLTARTMKALGHEYDFYVSAFFYEHPALRFIAPDVTTYKRWGISGDLPFREPGEKPLFIFLDSQKRSDFLEAQRYYPNASFEEVHPPFGGPPVLYTIRLTGDDLKSIQGLIAYYYRNEEWEGEAALEHQKEPGLSRVEGSLDLNWPDEAPWARPELALSGVEGQGRRAGPFSVEWRGVLYAPYYGPYLLKLEAPAKAQLYLDENLLLDGSGVMAQEITLAEGNHALRVRAVGAEGRVRLQWQTPGGEEAVVPTWALYRPPVTNNGLLGRYYQNLDWAGPPALARIDPSLSLYFHITPLPRPYTVEWQGVISIPRAGVYAFGLESIDDSRLYIDGRLVVETIQPNDYREGSVELTAGFHDIRLRYADRSSHSHINLYWMPPGQGRQIVPSQNLYPPQGSYTQILPPSRAPVAPVELGELALDFVSAWGSQGTGLSEFNEPRDIAVDGEGRLYVADTGNRRVQVFDSGGQFIASWEGGEEEFVEPLALVVDRRGDLYVLDSDPGWIYRFAADGSPLGRFAGPEARFFHPRGLAIDEADRLYVADTGGCRVVVYSTAGERLSQLGWKGGGPGQFLEPTDVALDDRGAIYVVDTSNQRVQHLDPWGGYRAEWSIPATGPYNGPHLALAPDGSLLMTAPERHQIQRYSPDGTFLDEWGSLGMAAGQFRIPVGLAVDQAGNVYVADTLNHRLQKFVLRGGQ
jgi:DNA-binding beta-propeller fold protein YncE/4-amino-4-deoxy-L-arabinose transferase-like glycosyltransferase